MLPFPRSINKKDWVTYLNRKLSKDEEYVLYNLQIEREINDQINNLYNNSTKLNLYIPKLTNLYGNCLFESLEIVGFITDTEQFRFDLSYYMYIFRDHKGFFTEHPELSLTDLYNFTNEIEYVVTPDNNIYKYSFVTMCMDLANKYSWSKLPTELILMVISKLYSVKFNILNNESDYIAVINCCSGNPYNNIYLGHLGESHYVPLVYNKDKVTNILHYNDAKIEFFKWGYEMEKLKECTLEQSGGGEHIPKIESLTI
jgi:hypothetical protein